MSLLCRLKKLVHKGELEEKDLDRIVIIPKDATNGDMIKAMFPDSEIIFKDGSYETTVDWHTKTHRCHLFDNDWWNSPYRKEQE